MKYYLGVDGGGSKTYALVVDENGKILGKGQGGNGNHQINREVARTNIEKAANEALNQSSLSREQIEFAYFGLAGADREPDFRILRPMLGSLNFPRFDVACDTMIGMRAGTEQPFGVVVICGSGTNCAGKNRGGRFYQCGGFTYELGDYGGGGRLAVEAFRSVIRVWDGREQETMLTELVLNELKYDSVAEMFDDFLDNNKRVPIHLAKLLFTAALKGDAVANRILQVQGEELGKSAVAVINRLGMEQDQFDVVLAGSIVTKGEGGIVNRYIEQAVKRVAPRASVKKLTVEPVIGSVWCAVEAAGGHVTKDMYEKLNYAHFEHIEI